jgi:hypothetical protein
MSPAVLRSRPLAAVNLRIEDVRPGSHSGSQTEHSLTNAADRRRTDSSPVLARWTTLDALARSIKIYGLEVSASTSGI